MSFGGAIGLPAFGLLVLLSPEKLWEWGVAFSIVTVASAWIGAKLITHILTATLPSQLIMKATGFLLLAIVPLVINYDRSIPNKPLEVPPLEGNDLLAVGYGILASLFEFLRSPRFLIWLFLTMVSAYLLLFWCVAVGPVVFAYALTACLRSVELVVRRIVEYPKGPVLALSALCGGVAALLKVFSN